MHERAQGWAAGLILLTKSAKTADIDLALFDKLAPEQVFDYFASELFDKADRTIRDFLLRTAFLPKITVPIAEKITGILHAGRILSDLNRNNYFTEKRQHAEISYQYHPLFREFLLARAQTLLSQMEVSRIRSLTAALLEQSGQIEDAAELFIEVRDWTGLTHLVLDHAQSLAAQGRSRTIESWITRIPREITEANPWLLYWMGISMLHYRPNDSASLFERAYNLFDQTENAAGVFLSWSGVVDSILLQFERFGRFDHWFRELERAVKKYKGFPALEIESRVTLSMFSALVLRIPHHPDAMKWRERMIALAKRDGDVNLETIAAFHAGWHELYVGHTKRSALFLQPVEKHIRSNQVTPLARLMIMMLSSIHCWLQGRNEECHKLVSEALRLADVSGVHMLDHQTLGSAITTALSVGDIEHAQELLQRMEGGSAAMNKAYYCYLASWYAVMRHDLSAALAFATAGLEFSERLEAPFPMAVTSLGAAVIYHELKNCDESVRQFKRAMNIAEDMNSPALLHMCNLAAAQFAFDLKKEAEGREALRKAMAIGKGQGYLNTYWWRQDVMARLSAKALEYGIEVEYVRDLIRKRNLNPPSPPFAKGGMGGIWMDSWPWPIRIKTLGRFERVKDAVHLREGNVTLDQRYFWVDTWAFEHMLESSEFGVQSSELNAKRQSAIGNRQSEMNLSLLEKALELYKGPFLGAESAPWAISLRERLRAKFLRAVAVLGKHLEKGIEYQKMIMLYEKALEVDDLAEEFYQRLMHCNIIIGRKAEAAKVNL